MYAIRTCVVFLFSSQHLAYEILSALAYRVLTVSWLLGLNARGTLDVSQDAVWPCLSLFMQRVTYHYQCTKYQCQRFLFFGVEFISHFLNIFANCHDTFCLFFSLVGSLLKRRRPRPRKICKNNSKTIFST